MAEPVGTIGGGDPAMSSAPGPATEDRRDRPLKSDGSAGRTGVSRSRPPGPRQGAALGWGLL
jgi:hypothetical protein